MELQHKFVRKSSKLYFCIANVLSMCMCCGAGSTPGAVSASCTWHMCWLYVVLGAHLCVGYMYFVVFGAHLVQEGSGRCKVPNFSHLHGVTGHICVINIYCY